MRDIANKMAELKFEAPLAQFEEADDWGSTEFQQPIKTIADMDELNFNVRTLKKEVEKLNDEDNRVKNRDANSNPKTDGVSTDNFNETFSGSLEDLVNTFDDKITKWKLRRIRGEVGSGSGPNSRGDHERMPVSVVIFFYSNLAPLFIFGRISLNHPMTLF
jgi:hypothetical protein